jgi:3-dehydroshikimate dehydratase
MKAGLVSITFRALPPEQIVELAGESGLAGIEWGGDVHVPHGDLETARRVGDLTRKAGLAVASYGSYYRFEECDLDTECGGPSMEAVLDTALALEAPAIRLWAGQRGPAETSPLVWSCLIDRTLRFADAAARSGLRLDFEFHENTLTETPESTLRLLSAIDHPSVHTLWQPPLRMPVAARLAGLRRVEPWVSNLHCNHFGQDPWPRIHPLAEGAEEWGRYLEALAPRADERWVLLEHVRDHAPEALREDARTLLHWLRKKASPSTEG